MTHQFTFLRHGISVGNQESILQGQLDSDLVESGKQQIHRLGRLWRSEGRTFNRIITSPLKRAKQTAGIIADHLGVSISEDPIWMERNFGAGQGLRLDEYEKLLHSSPTLSIYQRPFEGGESRWQLNARAFQAIEEIVQMEAGPYLFVSHGGFLNTLFRIIFGSLPQSQLPGLRIRIPNGGYLDFEFTASTGQWTLIKLLAAPDADDQRLV